MAESLDERLERKLAEKIHDIAMETGLRPEEVARRLGEALERRARKLGGMPDVVGCPWGPDHIPCEPA